MREARDCDVGLGRWEEMEQRNLTVELSAEKQELATATAMAILIRRRGQAKQLRDILVYRSWSAGLSRLRQFFPYPSALLLKKLD